MTRGRGTTALGTARDFHALGTAPSASPRAAPSPAEPSSPAARLPGELPPNRETRTTVPPRSRRRPIDLAARAADARLVERLRAGDEAAFREILKLHYTSLLALARVYVRSHAIAEEVVQDALVGVLEGLDRFEGRSSLKTWIFRILVYRAHHRARKEGRSVAFSDLGLDAEGGREELAPSWTRDDRAGTTPPATRQAEFETAEAIAIRNELSGRLRMAVDTLPPFQRAVVLLRDVEGLSAREACAILDIRETNQRVLLHRGRSKLRKTLEGLLVG